MSRFFKIHGLGNAELNFYHTYIELSYERDYYNIFRRTKTQQKSFHWRAYRQVLILLLLMLSSR